MPLKIKHEPLNNVLILFGWIGRYVKVDDSRLVISGNFFFSRFTVIKKGVSHFVT